MNKIDLNLYLSVNKKLKKKLTKNNELNKKKVIENIKNNFFLEIYDNKNKHRINCLYSLNLIKNIPIKEFGFGNKFETVLIEFRKFEHLEFLIRNTIIKLPKNWNHTVICGENNFNFIQDICNNICKNLASKIKIIKLKNINTLNEYNNLLLSKTFWNLFDTEKILIYQEDTMIFKDNINDFIEYDYIGAPWPSHKNDNSYNVGNGGFSLRTKKKMIECLNLIDPNKLIYSKSTINHKNNNNLDNFPEDVYFSKTLIDYNLGNVAKMDIAKEFSQELIGNKNVFGGHCYWLSKGIEFPISRLFNVVGIFSPYNYIMGGGEKYLSEIIKFFCECKYKILFFNNTDSIIFNKTLNYYLYNYKNNIKQINSRELKNYYKKVDYFIEMSNGKNPISIGIGIKNIFHCQFPFDLNKEIITNNLKEYDTIIVNSEFTKKFYEKYTQKYLVNKNIKILYPLSIDKINIDTKYNKKKNTFVMVGRIFTFNKNANNKYFDVAIKIFNKLDKLKNYKLYIIGSIVHKSWYYHLLNLSKNNDNIIFYPNATEEEKNNLLKKCKYYIHLAGIGKNENKIPFQYEHFGISIIEAINYRCIPICSNGGFPKYYIKNNENGYLIKNKNELKLLINHLITYDLNISDIHFNNYKKQLTNYTKEKYLENFSNIILNLK